MRAAVVERYGPPEVVTIRDVETPAPKDNEVLIRTRATTVNSGDSRIRARRLPRGMNLIGGFMLGFGRPRQAILGFDAAGEIESVGSAVRGFRPGDRVLGSRGFKFGCHAEYVAVPEDGALAKIPDGMSYTDAAALPFGAATALIFFGQGKLRAGESVLINGAAGAVGTMAVQIAKHMGATVSGVCSAGNADFVRSLGADEVIDYAREDFAAGGRRFDAVMDTHGNAPYSRSRRVLKPGGRFLMVVGDLPQLIGATGNKAIVKGNETGDVLKASGYARILDLAASGAIRPVIDSSYPFDQIAEAHRRVDTGHKRGSVVVTVP
jgi:NADPH:quinone reductase-like Zn-dependent oxidoreductase